MLALGARPLLPARTAMFNMGSLDLVSDCDTFTSHSQSVYDEKEKRKKTRDEEGRHGGPVIYVKVMNYNMSLCVYGICADIW